jgi:glucose-6-phosphate isomerase
MSSAEIELQASHRRYPGNRPSSTIVMDDLSPQSLGALVALYEHKVFVQGIIWQICSFDQWGVELGKDLAGGIDALLEGEDKAETHWDASTRGLVQLLRDRDNN